MCASAERSEKTVYHDISFQGKTGSLTMTSDKMVFRPKCDPVASSRSWLWHSIKKTQVAVDDTQEEKSVLKISNHSNKAVSFLVPKHAVHKLQEDMNSRMAAAQDLKKQDGGTETKRTLHRHKSADDTLHQAFQLAREAKVAKGTTKQQGKPTLAITEKARQTEPGADAASLETSKQNSTKPAFTRPKLQAATSYDCGTRLDDGRSQKVASLRSSATESARPGKVSLLHATKVITQDLFVKPSQQAIHDYCVSPANNLIVKPAKRNIIDPAQEKIIHPTQEMAKEMLVKPANEMIVKPTQHAAQMILLPSKIIAQDMGLLSRHEPVADDEAETTLPRDGSQSVSSHHKKHSFLHFLKAPPRRTVSDDSLCKEDLGTAPKANRSAKASA